MQSCTLPNDIAFDTAQIVVQDHLRSASGD